MIATILIDDAELLRRYADARDEDAFAELVRRYLGLVYHTARRQMSGDGHAAEDVTQRVFTLLARKAPSLRHHAALAGWLHTTTRFAASETLRVERRRFAREQEAFNMHDNPTVSPGFSKDAAWSDLRPVIDEALGELDAPDREAVLLRYFADLPHAQIGARFSISENAARMRVERALEKLHARLARRGVTSTATALGVVLAKQAGAASAALPVGMAASVTSGALAGSAATGLAASMAGVFGFMSTAKIVAGLAVVVGVAGLGSAFDERNHASQSEAMLAALRREAEELRGQATQNETLAREANQRAQASEARVAALQKEIASGRAVATSAPTAEALASRSAPRAPADDADVQKEKAKLHHRYDPFLLKQRGLTQAQADRFVELKLEQARDRADFQAAVERERLDGRSDEVMRLRAKLSAPLQREMREILGDEGMKAYNDYEMTSAYRIGFIEPIRPVFSAASVPLSPEQEEQLIRIINANVHDYRAKPTDIGTQRRFDWDAIQNQANAVLAPAQQPLLKLHLDKWRSATK